MKYLIGLLSFLICFNLFAGTTDADKADQAYQNYAINGGGELGKKGWSESGSGTLTVDTATKNNGKASIKFVTVAGGDYVATQLVACKSGPHCIARFYYKTTAATLTAKIYDNSANLIASLALPADTDFQPAELPFDISSSTTTYQLRVYDSTTGSTVYIDDYKLQKNDNVGSVNLQDTQYDLTTACGGSSCISGDNSWTTVRAIATPYKDKNNSWRIRYNLQGTSGSTSSINITLSGVVFKNVANYYQPFTIQTSGGAQGFAGYANPNTSVLNAINASATTTWRIWGDSELESMPTWATASSPLTVVSSGSSNAIGIDYHLGSVVSGTSGDNTVIFNTLVKDTSNGAYNPATGIFTVPEDGWYNVSGSVGIYGLSTSTAARSTIYLDNSLIRQGSFIPVTTGPEYTLPFAGNIYATKGQTIKAVISVASGTYSIDVQSYTKLSIAKWAGSGLSVIGNVTSTNQTRIESLHFAGATRDTACTGSPCTIYNSTGGAVNVTRSGAGTYAVNFPTGLFSQTISCTCTGDMNVSGSPICTMNSCTANSCTIYMVNHSSTPTDALGNIICHGLK